MTDVGLHLAIAPRLAMRPSPALVASIEILALSSAELERAIERELDRNPAIEPLSPRPPRIPGLAPPRAPAIGLPDEPDERERLARDAALALPRADRALAEHLAASLDERGRLEGGPERVAAELGVPLARVEGALAALRDAGPPGLGARDLGECLLLQIAALEAAGARVHPLARALVAEHLPALAEGRDLEVARALGAGREEVCDALAWVRGRLRPGPTFDRSGPPGSARAAAVPEILVREDPAEPSGLAVEIVERSRLGVRVSPAYRRLEADPGALAPADAARIARDVRRGGVFMGHLERRWRTLERVARRAVDHQAAFLRSGRGLRGLTRARLARDLGLHESTVSRAVAGKHLAGPTGRVVAFAALFPPDPGPREALAALIADGVDARSDAELARALAARGHRVARRTVAKYRAQLGVPAGGRAVAG
jgi:RNA polymerase sigma-54 factor